MPSPRRKPYTVALMVDALVTTWFLLSIILPSRCLLLTKQIGAGRRHPKDENVIWTRRVAQRADAVEEVPFRSYLYWPRLHFSGVFQADTATHNNALSNYNITKLNLRSWNPNGTGAFRLDRTLVTSICFPDGNCGAEKGLDPMIGSSIKEDGLGTSAKMVDLDPEHMSVSTIYGLQLRIGDFFSADFHPSPFTYLWNKAESNSEYSGDGSKGATYHTFLENIKWLKQAPSSPFLRTLREALTSSDNGKLSIRLHLDQYQMNSSSQGFTWGRVVGAIGASGSRAPLVVVHGRELEPRDENRAQSAPFVLDLQNGRVHVDFGNSLRTTSKGSHLVTSPGQLAVGYSLDKVSHPHDCSNDFDWLGLVHYRRHNWYQTTAGIQTFPDSHPMRNEQMSKLGKTSLVVAEVEGVWPNIFCKGILLEEAAHGTLVRPQGDFVFRRDAGEAFSFDLFVTKFGKPLPRAPVQLKLNHDKLENPPLKVPSGPSVTNNNGIASFTIPTSDPKNPRKIIDGQVYTIHYKVSDQSFGEKFAIRVLIWDKYQINSTPTWLQHVYPIFQLHAHLYPVMKEFLDLANFDEVIENRKLLQTSMTLPFGHPNHMPVTRDLSNAKRKMILEWLAQPQPLHGAEENDFGHAFGSKQAPVSSPVLNRGPPSVDETYPTKVLKVTPRTFDNTVPVPISSNKRTVGELRQDGNISKRVKEHLDKTKNLMKPLKPLSSEKSIRLTKDHKRRQIATTEDKTQNPHTSRFTLDQLQQDLQTALEVEHATIPPYLTALSSIKNGHNNKVSNLLKSILVQEMLHMSLVANLLNAVGGNPALTHQDFVPRYPISLPGGVQRGLVVQLQNLSLLLIKDVFMKIEEPILTIKGLEYRQYVTKHMDNRFQKKSKSFEDGKSFDESYATNTIKVGEKSRRHVRDVHSGRNEVNESKTKEGHNQKSGDQEEERREQEREFQATEPDAEGDEEWLDCTRQDDSSGLLKRGDKKSQSLFEEHKNTIGSFYHHIIKTLAHLTKCGQDNSIFTGHPSRQLTSEVWYSRKAYGHGKIIKVTDYFSAVRAITEIMEQGEGSSPCVPVAAGVHINDLSHYFSFYSIYKGRMIHLRNWNGKRLPAGISDDVRQWWEVCHSIYTFDGEKIDFDPAGVWPIVHNARLSHFIPWSKPYMVARTFNTAYTKLLNSLERAYNGQPEVIKEAMGLMFSVSLNAKRLVRMPIRPGDDPDVGPNAAPIYEPII